MASIYDLKPAFQNLLRPLTAGLARAGVTANQVTISAVLLSLAGGGAIALAPTSNWPLLLLPVILFIRMGLNAIDGMLAREHGQKTKLGAVLNELGDVVSDTALYLPLSFVPGIPAEWIVGIVVLAIVSELAGVIGLQIGASRRYDGPMGKSDRAFFFGALALLLGLGVPLGIWLDILVAIVVGLLLVTIGNRARRALEEASEHAG